MQKVFFSSLLVSYQSLQWASVQSSLEPFPLILDSSPCVELYADIAQFYTGWCRMEGASRICPALTTKTKESRTKRMKRHQNKKTQISDSCRPYTSAPCRTLLGLLLIPEEWVRVVPFLPPPSHPLSLIAPPWLPTQTVTCDHASEQWHWCPEPRHCLNALMINLFVFMITVCKRLLLFILGIQIMFLCILPLGLFILLCWKVRVLVVWPRLF